MLMTDVTDKVATVNSKFISMLQNVYVCLNPQIEGHKYQDNT